MSTQLCVALDGGNRQWILDMARLVGDRTEWLKIGLEAFTSFGPDLVERVQEAPARVFLDLKLHDIPNTVARAAASCARLGVGMLNVHASGGERMMRAAVDAVRAVDSEHVTKVIAVTVLTSLAASDLVALGHEQPPDDLVLRWAGLAQQSGLDGVVASAREAAAIRRVCGPDFLVVTPGIRPVWAAADDQRRVVTPEDACRAGADVLVIGRPITGADDPLEAIARIRGDML